jgi:hypothetical protein
MAAPQLPAWNNQNFGSQLNLTGYSLAFDDNFNTMDIVSEHISTTNNKWFAPVHPMPRSVVNYIDPDPRFSGTPVNPFSVANGALTIRMEQVNGQWQSGTMQSTDWRGGGFALNEGYFEMRAKFPDGRGSWPAFWLISQNNTTGERIEYDIVEAYPGDLGHHNTVHVTNSEGKDQEGDWTNLNGAMFDGQFHTYGGLITDNLLITYFDGKELARMDISSIPAFDRANFYMIVTLAGNPSEMPYASGQNDMVIDYVRAYGPGSGATPPNPTPTPAPTSGGPTEGADFINSTGIAETLRGYGGDDEIHGQGGNDHIYGGTGNDRLNGEAGNDVLYGEAGDDRFDGGDGSDWLQGMAGRDTFVFDNTLGASNVDTIADFNVADDTIWLENAVFRILTSTGTLASGNFYIGAQAHDADDRIIYDSATGALLYDADGNGSGAAIKFATLAKSLALTNADFIVT